MIRISAKRDGFRRGGIAHPKAPTDYPDDRFSAEELALLKSEPNLSVEILEAEISRPNAKATIVLIEAAATVAELDALNEGEDRKTVLEAIAKRRAELASA